MQEFLEKLYAYREIYYNKCREEEQVAEAERIAYLEGVVDGMDLIIDMIKVIDMIEKELG